MEHKTRSAARKGGAQVTVALGAAVAVALGAALAVGGCDRGSATPGKPAAPVAETPKLTLIAPEATNWSRTDALEHLSDAKLGVSAAVRLVRLAEVSPLCVPRGLTDATAARLRLVALGEGVWALGLVGRRGEAVLHAPVLIGADGGVTIVAEGTEEEALTLHVSKDAGVFPHLLISPLRVLITGIPPRPALALETPDTIGFQRREQEGYAYVALMVRGEKGWMEAAQYKWDPFELAFSGPAADNLPDPPGGKFQLDMKGSPMLIPMGGEMPEPKQRRPAPGPRNKPPWDEA